MINRGESVFFSFESVKNNSNFWQRSELHETRVTLMKKMSLLRLLLANNRSNRKQNIEKKCQDIFSFMFKKDYHLYNLKKTF